MTDLSQQGFSVKTDSAVNSIFNVVIMAGGTGGHIFPGLAVAQELQRRNWNVSWLGSAGGMEVELIGKTKIPLYLISISGLRGNGIFGWIKAPFTLLKAVVQALIIIRKQKPDVVIGFGGFASGPGGVASFLAGTPLLIHEQNAVAGLTNKILAKFAKKVFQAFPDAFETVKNVETVGNPIRKAIIDLDKNRETKTTINLLVVGGSRGARVFNDVLPEILAPSILSGEVNVRHQSGKDNYSSTISNYEANNIKQGQSLNVEEFIDEMEQAYLWADLVICRAGALTVSEIAAVGVAAIFVPFPYAVDDHQTKNALWLVEQEAAILIHESNLKSETSRKEIVDLVANPKKINDMATKAKKIAYINATVIMADACEVLMGKAA